jgi:hypothetical protein
MRALTPQCSLKQQQMPLVGVGTSALLLPPPFLQTPHQQ